MLLPPSSDGWPVLSSTVVSLSPTGTMPCVEYNLGKLKPAVGGLVGKCKAAGAKSVSVTVDMKLISMAGGGLKRSGTPQLGGSKRAVDALRGRMRCSACRSCTGKSLLHADCSQGSVCAHRNAVP